MTMMDYEMTNSFLNTESIMKYFENNHSTASASTLSTIPSSMELTAMTSGEINNSFDDLIKKILGQDGPGSLCSSSSSSSSSLFGSNVEDKPTVLKPLQLKSNETRLRPKTSGSKFNQLQNSYNNSSNKENRIEVGGNALQMPTSCKNLIFKSLNSSNTIFIQPHDVLTPLSEGEFREYKLFPIIQN